MSSLRIIARLDIKGSNVVKGINLEGIRKIGDPKQLALKYYKEGIDEIIYMDVVASLYERNTITKFIKDAASKIFVPLTVGGGIRSLQDVRSMLNAGADKVSINTAAIKEPGLVHQAAESFGSQCIVVAMDVKLVSAAEEPLRYEVYTHGGRQPTGIEAVSWARKVASSGAGEILLTSMDCDGTRSGFDLTLTNAISEAVHIPIIASGGVGNLQHLVDGVTHGGADAVLAASIFHFGEYSLEEAKIFMANKGVEMRL